MHTHTINADHTLRTTRHQGVSPGSQTLCQRLAVGHDLLLVGHKLGRGCLLEGTGKARDGVVVGAPLLMAKAWWSVAGIVGKGIVAACRLLLLPAMVIHE